MASDLKDGSRDQNQVLYEYHNSMMGVYVPLRELFLVTFEGNSPFCS